MQYEWDDTKREINLAKHGVDFTNLFEFEWDTAVKTLDDRRDYNEQRWVAFGYIRSRLHVIAYTLRSENIRVISLRRANQREVEQYGKKA